MYYSSVLVLLSAFQCILSVPLDSKNLDDITAQKYLQQFGYMKKTPYNQQLVTGEQWKKKFTQSLIQFQKFAGLPQTGLLDDDTKETMSLPRCGVSDEDPLKEDNNEHRRSKRYALQGSRWRSAELSYGISKYPSGSNFLSKVSEKQVDDVIKKALEVWSQDTPLKFKRKYSGGVQLDISFHKKAHGDGDPFDGYGGTLAHAFFPQYGGDAHFDDEEFWTVGKTRGTNLFQVAAHEFGHSLGLSHSNMRSSLMAPFYRGFQKNFKLHEDDIEAIQTLYGKKKQDNKPSVETPEDNPDKEDDIDNTIGQADDDAPDLCHDSSINAVVKTKNMFSYVFKGDYYWRIVDEGLADGYPRKISADWDDLPGNIDAALTWKDGRTFFFKGDKYWRFTNKRMHPGYPKKISTGFEGIPNNVDAALVHSKNKKTYFFKGDQYWRFDSKALKPVSDMYPRPITSWEGLPNRIDASFEWKNGKDYFFHGSRYYRLKKGTYSVDKNYPRSTSIWWFGCKADSETANLRIHPERQPRNPARDDFEIEVRLDHDEENSHTKPVPHTSQDSLDTAPIEIGEFEREDTVVPMGAEKEKLTGDKNNGGEGFQGTMAVGITLILSLLV